ncbi:MAG: hypothetical protein ACP6IS_12715 [Candidatus Asgardarchaeia archaeon]
MSEGILIKTNLYVKIATLVILLETVFGYVLSFFLKLGFSVIIELAYFFFVAGLFFVFLSVYIVHFFARKNRKNISSKHVLIGIVFSFIPSIFGILVQLVKASYNYEFFADIFTLALMLLSLAGVYMIKTFVEEL